MKRIFLDNYVGLNMGIKLIQLYGEFPGKANETHDVHYNTYDGPNKTPPCVVPLEGINYSFKKSILFSMYNWIAFSAVTGAKHVYEIGIYQYEHDPYEMLYFGRNAYPKDKYIQAKGIPEVTGDKCEEGMILANKFTKMHPYIIATGDFSSEFDSDLFISQIAIESNAVQGYYVFPDLRITAVID